VNRLDAPHGSELERRFNEQYGDRLCLQITPYELGPDEYARDGSLSLIVIANGVPKGGPIVNARDLETVWGQLTDWADRVLAESQSDEE
jgi:hypothetical protein